MSLYDGTPVLVLGKPKGTPLLLAMCFFFWGGGLKRDTPVVAFLEGSYVLSSIGYGIVQLSVLLHLLQAKIEKGH